VDAAEHIVPLLDVSDSKTRYWAVWALVQLDARMYKENIFAAVKQSEVRDAIKPYGIAALIKWEDARAIPMAITRLMEDDMSLRDTMADRLVNLDAKQIVQPLIECLHDPTIVNSETKIHPDEAMRLIAKLDPNEAIPILRGYAREEDQYLAMVAAKELGKIRASEGIPELLALLDRKDPSGGTWHRATCALAQIGQRETIPRVLSELKQKKPNSHHVDVLQYLSVASDPNTYQKLHSLKIEKLKSLNIPESLKQLSERCGITMVLSKNIETGDCARIVSFATEDTAIKHLLRILNGLNYSAHKYTFFIADGIVNIVTIQEAYSFWETWSDTSIKQMENKKNHPSKAAPVGDNPAP